MAGLCRILTAALVLAHFTMGCCAHHAHACGCMDHSLPVHGAITPDSKCAGSGANNTHHCPDDCQGSRCSVVLPSRAVSESFVQCFQASFIPLLDDAPSLCVILSGQYFFSTDRLLPPIRLHLVNQVQLI